MKPIHTTPTQEEQASGRQKAEEQNEPLTTSWNDDSDYLQNDFFTECNF